MQEPVAYQPEEWRCFVPDDDPNRIVAIAFDRSDHTPIYLHLDIATAEELHLVLGQALNHHRPAPVSNQPTDPSGDSDPTPR